jgi:hypothetical protein
VAEGGLAGDDRRKARRPTARFRRRDGHQHRAFSFVRLGSQRAEGALLLRASQPRAKNTTLVASMSVEGMGPTLAVEGTTNREVFEAYYVERVLAPTLRPGQVVVMDNLCAHKGHKVRQLIERRRCELLFLPPYSSPELKWDEKAEIMLRRSLRG